MASAAAAAQMRTAAGGGGGGGGGGGALPRPFFNGGNKESMALAGGPAMAAPLPPAYLGAPRKPRKLEQVDLFK